MLTRHSLARELPASKISARPFANGPALDSPEYVALREDGFAGWQPDVDGLVASPPTFSLAHVRQGPARRQTTALVCEEGWSYIAEWTGVPLSHLLELVGVRPEAKFAVYESIDPNWMDAIDMADVAYGFNGADLPPEFGGPMRMRVPRQLGYKSVKYLRRITLTDRSRGTCRRARTRGTPGSDRISCGACRCVPPCWPCSSSSRLPRPHRHSRIVARSRPRCRGL